MEYLGAIRSGVITNLVPFRAPAGFGSSGWKVTRSRNGGTAADFTTPTIAEQTISGHDSQYWLTVDEDTTLGGGHTPTRTREMMTLTIQRTTADEIEPIYGFVEIYVDDQSHHLGHEQGLASSGATDPPSPIGWL